MRWISTALASAGWIWLAATGSGAETYRILSGTLTDDETGRTEELVGALEAAPPDPRPTTSGRISLFVDDFELRAGHRSFTPRPPIEYQGMTPSLFLEVANHIQVDGDGVGLVHLRSGGEQIADDGEEVTYRFLDFRGGGAFPGSAVGLVGDGPLPRRLHIVGTLREVDQTFRLFSGECGRPPLQPIPLPPIEPPPLGGGGIQISAGGGIITPDVGGTIQIGGSDVTLTMEDFDLSLDEPVTFMPPLELQPLARVVGAEPSEIDGQLQAGGSVFLLAPTPLEFGPTSQGLAPIAGSVAPTLEELGITAPDGADVTFDDAGVLSVVTAGDLFVEGRVIDIPGLTSLVLVASGNIVITGTLDLPSDVALRIEAGGSVEIEDGSLIPYPGGEIVVEPPPIIVTCSGLQTVVPAVERVVGRFSLVATAARPVEIDVEPWSRHDRVYPGRRQPLPVALLGSQDLDVRDVEARSLRFGPGEAAAWAHFGSGRGRRIDVNRDRYADLVALFSVREAEIAFGDRLVCLVGETRDGDVIEGCDEIDTIPRWGRSARGQGR